MISINNLTVAYGGFTLLNDINFHISENDKIGLVGKNGAGKSTILKIICGLQHPTSGKVAVPPGIKIGYLPQIMEHHKGKSVIDETMTAFADVLSLEKEYDKITQELAGREDYDSKEYQDLIIRMNDINDRLSYTQTESPQVLAEKTLLGLGFKYEELTRATETFSQGWNMRIELAKILLSKPDILLLDEPTNHLDIESIEWFESYLKEYKGALVLISHDRKFLDNVTNRTVEIMLGRIHDYKVPYSKYLELRKERIAQQQAAYENQQKMIAKSEEFIEKFRYKPTKSNQVQSRIKQLEKLERIEVDVEDKSALCVKFPPAPRSGDVVFKATDLTVGYGEKVVFSHASIEVRRGEKVAFVGRNGEGKTTLMRVIMGELQPMSGEAKLGYNVNIGYYAQNQEDILDKKDTVYETLDKIAVGDIRTKLRDILAAFLFKGEDIDKKVAVLSGGERARLAMAKLMLNPYNLLALDEPTNHMDIRSKDILKQALKAYDGTLIVVSHDRDFLDGLVDKLYEFRDGKVKEHLGTIAEFLERRKIENLNELERHFKPAQAKTEAEQEKKTVSQQEYQAKKFVSKEERRIRNRISFLEKSIAEVEAKMKEIETRLASPGPQDDIMDLTREYLEDKRKLDSMTEEWVAAGESLDNGQK
ncbi:MAG: ABC-F family ATP-binding cassette domain-containing protein [Bacteroidetes bacterium]|uniref:Probable ATP-binding protein YbiT n=1 Tax=Candidatus Cryptobacteroides intestinigallinarum TaxID=2840767 RepID=A0A9D9HMK3_9BACT|nr:ABC-F family ATP-binding cassette domain-containing protein [Candidatus Cryptobacteroides intestinigallinarum]